MQFKPLLKTTDEINTYAESFLKTHHSSFSIPVPIEDIVDLQMRIDIIPIHGLKKSTQNVGLDIDAFISSDFKSISVDKYISENINTRFRFTLAHEIGHMLLHGYLYSKHKFNTTEEWVNLINEIPLSERELVESEANEFAGLVLVPKQVLQDQFEANVRKAEETPEISFREDPELATSAAIYYLHQIFHVSRQVMSIRIERDKCKEMLANKTEAVNQ